MHRTAFLSLLLAVITIGCKRTEYGSAAVWEAEGRACHDQAPTVGCLVRRLPLGTVEYRVPDPIRRHETRPVLLRLSPTKPTPEARRTLIALKGPGVAVGTSRVRFSRRMQATLDGSDFDIDSSPAPRVRTVSESQPTEWRWDIRPLHGGRLSLHIAVDAIITLDGKSTPTPYAILDTTVTVTTTWQERGNAIVDWVEDHWVLLGVLAIVGVTIFGVTGLSPPWERVR